MKKIFLISLFYSLISLIYPFENKGSYKINYDQADKALVKNVETYNDGYVYIKNNGKVYKILPDSNIEFIDDNNYILKNGIVVIRKGILNYGLFKRYSVSRRFFLNNEQGKAQFYRISIPNVMNFKSNVKIIYFIKDESKEDRITKKEINTKIHYLFAKNRKKYLGFFIPLNLYWKIIKFEIEIDLNHGNSIVVKIKDEQVIKEKEWQSQIIYFKEEKSKELISADFSKFRIEEEERKKIYSRNNSFILFKNGYDYPVEKDIYITSEFGAIREWKLISGKTYMKNIHDGIDIAKPSNFNIYAPGDGIIRYTATTELFGNMMIIEHGLSCFTSYAHLDKYLVQQGAKVKKGDLIAISGNTGAATGIHLHWGARIYGITVDPRTFLNIKDIFIP